MNLTSKVLIFISCILAFTTMLFFFNFVTLRTENKALKAQRDAFSLAEQKRAYIAEAQHTRTEDEKRMAMEAKNQVIDKLSIASETKADLERRVAESMVAHKETIARLNVRLERETQAKQKAEKESEKYFTQKEALEHDLLMLWAEMESLKAANNAKVKELAAKFNESKGALEKEIKALKSELENSKPKPQALEQTPAK